MPASASAVLGDGANPGTDTVQRYFAGGVWLGNVLSGAPASTYPSGNFYPTSIGAIGFVNLASGNVRLAGTSAYRHTATDGSDPGYDADALIATVPPSVLLCSASRASRRPPAVRSRSRS